MKRRIQATAFNGQTINCGLEIYLEDLTINQPVIPSQLLSENALAHVRNTVLSILQKVFPDFEIRDISYRLVSRDLENMQVNQIKPDQEALATSVAELVLGEIANRVGVTGEGGIDALRARQDIFARVLLGEHASGAGQRVVRLLELFKDRKFRQLQPLLDDLDSDSLSLAERASLAPLELSLKLRQLGCHITGMENLFSDYRNKHGEHPRVIKQGYFAMIQALEDCRDMTGPRRYLAEFEQHYPLSVLMPEERCVYFYHKGRSEYARGEFIGALELLGKAANNSQEEDLQMSAAIDTIAANCLSDNLFFTQGRQLAESALHIRTQLDLAEAFESQGCLAGIAFKQGDFAHARLLFQEYERLAEGMKLSDEEQNRLHNYLAKSAIMTGEFETAADYLDKALAVGDRLGFSAALRLLLLFRQQQFTAMNELFIQSCMLPENHKAYDNFSLGWGYCLMAQAEFEKELFDSGVTHLARAVEFFKADLYHMEAAYILRYLWEYPVPQASLERFQLIQPSGAVMDIFSSYVAKHEDLPRRYARLMPTEHSAGTVSQVANLHRVLDELQALENLAVAPVTQQLDAICLY